MKQFPFDKRYEIEDASGVVEYYIDGDEYIRGQDGVPGYRIAGYEVYEHSAEAKLVGFLEGQHITTPDADILLTILDDQQAAD
ncbi:hypothetical protein [Yersinia intermedia]|jgi:hypothetical protein|uniref:Uncharacterized protein n=1 Tax=Yersinia intermedia TaxID=631 RepID=A0A209A4J8_YERIN|nr:hypothetical protein [Yersinia intermedia]OVZ87628.1 hypothetical protein CBW57_08590 [Yersinia intermedia]CNB66658.1 Uncharacterised protein [Yersinia intermedia]CRE37207.1 Uncharacterised protein [Yersinia intermedia]